MKLRISNLLSIAALSWTCVSADLASQLLQLHRSTRSSVGAPDMKSLSWSSSLASGAQVIFSYFFLITILYFNN